MSQLNTTRRGALGLAGGSLLAATSAKAKTAGGPILRPYRRIATEEAFATPALITESRRVLESGGAEPGFAAMGRVVFGDSFPARMLHDRLLDLGEKRIAQMDADGVDLALLSITSPGVQVLETSRAIGVAAEANDILAEAVRTHPTRFAGLAAVAPQDPESAAREMERAKRLGLKGFLINSHTRGEYLDLPKFDPIFEAAQALDMPLYLHPREPGPSSVAPYLDHGLYFATWGFAAETSLHAMRLIMSGLFDRYPRLRITLGHMGEGLPFWLSRIDNRYKGQALMGVNKRLARLPSEYFRDNFVITTSGMMDEAALRLAISVLGVERIQFAGDFPYEDVRAGVDFLNNAKISDAERRAIFETNATHYWRL
jgi:5-carboxyvanillate decarboxylase